MDFDRMKASGKKILGELLPPDFVVRVATAIMEHREVLVKNFDAIVDEIKPHARAAMIEAGAGMLDGAEVEKHLQEFLRDLGFAPPPEAPSVAPAASLADIKVPPPRDAG